MRVALIILTIIICSTSVRAEYNGYHIQFEFETVKGEINIGFVYIPSAYLNTDSLKNTNYLKKALGKGGGSKRFFYFKDRIKYEYRDVRGSLSKKNPIYALNNKQEISSQEIRSIVIVEMIDYTYMINISSPLSISDTVWINKEPLNGYVFNGNYCSHQVFVHQNSEKIESIIKRLKTIQAQSKDDDKIDDTFWKVIEELYGKKVVVISDCSC